MTNEQPGRRPLLLDLFCGAGGAAVGYHRAGFDVIGVDIKPQPRYPFIFFQADALEFLSAHADKVDAVHASPPCQSFTKQAKQKGTASNHPDLIKPTRDGLGAVIKPYVIENVLEARRSLKNPVMLCGTQFNLGVFRHRLFETSWTLPALRHSAHNGHIGDGRFVSVTGSTGGSSVRDGVTHGRKTDWQRAMEIDWMSAKEMAQSIPPAYTEHVERFLIAVVSAACHQIPPR